jgi:hypothetical protein
MEERRENMNEAFAIFPDGHEAPTAFFLDLEDATEWALEKYGSDSFSIKFLAFVAAEPQQPKQN